MKCNIFFLVFCFFLVFLTSNAFAQSDYVAVAHVIYGGNNLYYADNQDSLKLSYRSLSKGEDGMFTIRFTKERLADGKNLIRRLRFGLGCTTRSCTTNLNENDAPLLAEVFPEYDDSKEKQPVYEAWIVINDNGTLDIKDSKPDIKIDLPKKKTIRFLTPWNNTSAVMYLNGNENNMSPLVSPYCGWFETSVFVEVKDVYVYFKQSIGGHYVGAEGYTDEEISINQEILLDSVLALSDTVWVSASLYSVPELYTEFPGELGDCPLKNLPVMMFDWLHGDGEDKENIADQAGTTSQDFGTGGCAQLTKGMVERELGTNGVPVRASKFPSNCKYTEHLDYWFVPEVITEKGGKTYTNATCRNLELTLTDDGFWLGQKNKESLEKGLFFLDDFKYLDDDNSIRNPMYDSIDGGSSMGVHNYGFTMKIQAQFEYVEGQYFEFLGDDDVWVFINNKLVVDIGGQHHASSGSVKLDTIGKNNPEDKLVPGQTYPFHIFYAERHKVESNFKMRTSIDLKTESSMYLKDLSDDPKLIKKEVWQILRERALACDFSSDVKTRDTLGPSDFVLYGKSLGKEGVELKVLDSAYYEGITITGDYTQVIINVKKIREAKALPPGNYYIRVRLKKNHNEYKDIPFTITPYELPNLAFAGVKDSNYFVVNYDMENETEDTLYFTQYWHAFGDSLSRDVSSDTLSINLLKEKMWAGRLYPVNIMYVEDWARIYSDVAVSIKTSTPNLIACDSMGNEIQEVLLDSGRASFFIKAIDEVVDGVLTISSVVAKNKSVNWTKINIAVPPVPQIETAYIFDRTGDGRADSIWIKFNKPLGGKSKIDSLKFVFGTSFDSAYTPHYKEGETEAVLVAKGDGFGNAIFTGGESAPYSGKLGVWYKYTDDDGEEAIFSVDGSLIDKVGPVVTAAEVSYAKDGNTQLTLAFSEGIVGNNASSDFFRFHCWKNNTQDSIVKTASDILQKAKNRWVLIFPKGLETDVVPMVGDSVRFRPPSQLGEALDLVEVAPHEKNSWVRITGEQRVTITSPKLVTLSTESDAFDSARAIIRSKDATVPKLVLSDRLLSADDVSAIYGTQGHYLGDLDMGKLVENEIAEIVKAVRAKPFYTDKDEESEAEENGTTPKEYSLEDILRMVKNGDMSIKQAQKRFGLDPVIVDAYKGGLLDVENVQNYARGSDADIEKIINEVADNTELHYKSFYYTSLGHYVNSNSGVITCNDEIFKQGGSKNCRDNGDQNPRLFLAWNMRSEKGRLAETGVYIGRLIYWIKVNRKILIDRTQDMLMGFRRGKVNAVDLGL